MNSPDTPNRVMDILQKQAPIAWAKTQLVSQVDARIYLLTSAIIFVILGIASYILLERCYHAPLQYGDWPCTKVTLFIIGVILGAGSSAALLTDLLSPWAWVTAINPSLGAAHLALMHFGISQ